MGYNIVAIWVLLTASVVSVSGGSAVRKLPGFAGDLPFKLQTGYVGVGEKEEVQLFYYLVESESTESESEKREPLVVWISGGPGCSSAAALFYQNGPLTFSIEEYDGNLPKLHLNPYAWTKGVNMLYLDGPVGTGFSYAKTSQLYRTGDYKFVAHVYQFIHKWLLEHPQFSTTPLYLSGDGYSGNIVPMVISHILNGNQVGSKPQINIKGYMLGNPGTDVFIDFNSRVPLVHQLGLISDELYKSAKRNCDGDYISPNRTEECAADIDAIRELLSNINNANTLDPTCHDVALDTNDLHSARQQLKEKSRWFFQRQINVNSPDLQCRKFNHMLCYVWANEEKVQEALHIRKGTVSNWQFCKDAVNAKYYTHDVPSVVDYHRNFTKTSLRALIYSGDHDTGIPYIGTQEWIWSLNMTLIERWRAWSVDNETAGFTRKFKNKDFSLTYATVKGAGHFAAEYKGKECAAMVQRWMTYNPI